MSKPTKICDLLKGLILLGNNEDSRGKFQVTLDYDNYQDGARVLDGDGKVLGECYDDLGGEEQEAVERQFVSAIQSAISLSKAKVYD